MLNLIEKRASVRAGGQRARTRLDLIEMQRVLAAVVCCGHPDADP
jgi:hypothetical protein